MELLITFLFGKLIITSALTGQVLLNNLPVKNATIALESNWAWANEKILNKVNTDNTGNFYFPEITRSSFSANWLPHEPVLRITVLIEYNQKIYKAFLADKRNYKRFSEFPSNKAYKLVCHLEKEPSIKDTHFGICDLVEI